MNYNDWMFLPSEKIENRRSKIQKNIKNNEKFRERIDNNYFDVIKNLTILSGTIFATSITLSIDKELTDVFIFGEFFLLIATLIGALNIWVHVKSSEILYFFDVYTQLEDDLSMNKDILSELETIHIKESIKSYQGLIDKKGILDFLLRIIKVDWLPTLFFVTMSIGLFILWFSLFLK